MPATTIVDASINDLSGALASGSLTSVDLVTKYLLRIAKYDCRGSELNSIPIISQDVFHEAAAADDRRRAGESRGPLDGIPFTVKDSYKVKGMTVASGSDAFENLVANEDAFTVSALREAGAILLGKTNMCPMAYGGMIRGIYGRSESPYNKDFLPAAFGSGSSHGSGVSVAASFAAFGMGEETVSSGRSPASNNALVAYTPSRGLISIRGNWPLYPTCDVVVPHTRSVADLLSLLDIITNQDDTTTGDFWRDQPFLQIPPPEWKRPESFTAISREKSLQGKAIAVPTMYIRQVQGGPFVSDSIEPLWQSAKRDLEAMGAIVVELEDFPVMRLYEKSLAPNGDSTLASPNIPKDWNITERGLLIAHAWEDFLQNNEDPSIHSLVGVNPSKFFPQMTRDDPQLKYTEPSNMVQWSKLAGYITGRSSTRPGKSCMYDVPELEAAVLALEGMRKQWFEEWMIQHNFDLVAFPAVGDVAAADADVDYGSAEHAWKNGVKYSHGNRAFRHLGIPSVTVPMGQLEPQEMPIGLTFLGRAYDDVQMLQIAQDFERITHRRTMPQLTPPLNTDIIPPPRAYSAARPDLQVNVNATVINHNNISIDLRGRLSSNSWKEAAASRISIFVDGESVPASSVSMSTPHGKTDDKSIVEFNCKYSVPGPSRHDSRNEIVGKVARDSIMVVVNVANGSDGWPAGFVKLIHVSDIRTIE